MRVGLLLALVAWGCGSSEKPSRIATLNVGLAPGYEQNVSERKPAIQAALAAAAEDLDVLCVQEYWDEGHWNDLAAAAKPELPHALRRAAEPGPASCTAAELDPLVACLDGSCPGKSGQDLVSCALASCGANVNALSSGCVACVTNDLTVPLPQIYAACVSGASGGGGDTPALYGGVFDVGLLGRRPFLATDSRRLDAFMVRVGVLYAKVATGAGDLHVFCTHLNSDIGSWSYGGTHASWREENTVEAQQLLDYVNEKAAGGAAVILGDLNTGAAAGAIEAEWPESLGVLSGAGFAEAFVPPQCSLCPDNTQRSPTSSPKLVDHVLLRGVAGKATVERILTAPVTVQVGGAPVLTSLSDHYGLAVTIEQ